MSRLLNASSVTGNGFSEIVSGSSAITFPTLWMDNWERLASV